MKSQEDDYFVLPDILSTQKRTNADSTLSSDEKPSHNSSEDVVIFEVNRLEPTKNREMIIDELCEGFDDNKYKANIFYMVIDKLFKRNRQKYINELDHIISTETIDYNTKSSSISSLSTLFKHFKKKHVDELDDILSNESIDDMVQKNGGSKEKSISEEYIIDQNTRFEDLEADLHGNVHCLQDISNVSDDFEFEKPSIFKKIGAYITTVRQKISVRYKESDQFESFTSEENKSDSLDIGNSPYPETSLKNSSDIFELDESPILPSAKKEEKTFFAFKEEHPGAATLHNINSPFHNNDATLVLADPLSVSESKDNPITTNVLSDTLIQEGDDIFELEGCPTDTHITTSGGSKECSTGGSSLPQNNTTRNQIEQRGIHLSKNGATVSSESRSLVHENDAAPLLTKITRTLKKIVSIEFKVNDAEEDI